MPSKSGRHKGKVEDRQLIPLVEARCPQCGRGMDDDHMFRVVGLVPGEHVQVKCLKCRALSVYRIDGRWFPLVCRTHPPVRSHEIMKWETAP